MYLLDLGNSRDFELKFLYHLIIIGLPNVSIPFFGYSTGTEYCAKAFLLTSITVI